MNKVLFYFLLLIFSSCTNSGNSDNKKCTACFRLKNTSDYDRLVEFNEYLVGKDTYQYYLGTVNDSIVSWRYRTKMKDNLDSDTSRYRYWGFSPVLQFNVKKNCFLVTVYYAINVSADSLKKNDQEWKEYNAQIERGEYSSKNYMGSEVIEEPQSPHSIQEYSGEHFVIKIRNKKLYCLGSLSGGIPGNLDHFETERSLLKKLYPYQLQNYIEIVNGKYCMKEYYLNLNEKDFE